MRVQKINTTEKNGLKVFSQQNLYPQVVKYLIHFILEIIQKLISDAIYTIGIEVTKKAKITVNMREKNFPVVATSLAIAAMNTRQTRI